jgi:hypothetical protein
MKAKKEHPILVVAPTNDLKQRSLAAANRELFRQPALRGMLIDQLGMKSGADTHAKYRSCRPSLPCGYAPR